ncbi:MAG: hypothetical protein DI533_21695 [Cereibacter sphaeroides]|uniref:DUF1419 domain-containing protein n=1 Tax=Cereibacter sphaeroides TaxID=1063 RepID=A0A2W5RVF8_CERSP|nr:MAG: hypothetical protein DI533_21695 [Cereibacter sphaeroides]
MTHTAFRRVALGAATRAEMYALFGRYDDAPYDAKKASGALWAGEWFEIEPDCYDLMLEVMPPLFYRRGMFGMSEFKAGDVTMVFCEIPFNGITRYFAGYCDMSVPGSPDQLRQAIVDREIADDARTPRREEALEIIWNATHPDFKGFAGSLNPAAFPPDMRGKRSILVNGGGAGTVLTLLEYLDDDQIADKLKLKRIFVRDTYA